MGDVCNLHAERVKRRPAPAMTLTALMPPAPLGDEPAPAGPSLADAARVFGKLHAFARDNSRALSTLREAAADQRLAAELSRLVGALDGAAFALEAIAKDYNISIAAVRELASSNPVAPALAFGILPQPTGANAGDQVGATPLSARRPILITINGQVMTAQLTGDPA